MIGHPAMLDHKNRPRYSIPTKYKFKHLMSFMEGSNMIYNISIDEEDEEDGEDENDASMMD